MELNDSIKTIKGIGDKTASAFARLGIETVNDLLLNYPRTYVTYEDPVDISDLQAGSRQSVRAVVNSRAEVRKVLKIRCFSTVDMENVNSMAAAEVFCAYAV